jgi:hypothetical protein
MTIPAAPREASPAVTTIEGTWFVKTRQGVLSLSLDELDEAFQRGDVDASTKVFTSGMAAWDTLGRVANLEGGIADAVAANDSAKDETSEIVLKPLDASSLPPTDTGVFGTGGSPWASISSPEPQEPSEGHTVVRRSTGLLPYALRKAAGKVADIASTLRYSHPRLAVAGPWLFGALLSGIFVFALYRAGSAPPDPSATTKTVTKVRATVSPEPSAAKPVTSPAQSSLAAVSPASRSLSEHLAAGAADRQGQDGVTIRPLALQPATEVRADTARPAPRAVAKAKKAGKKSKAQRKAAKARKRRTASLD